MFYNSIIDFNTVATPGITYRYDRSVRGKILNYSQALTENDRSQDLTCNCSNSVYCNPVLGHVVTGDMNFVENAKLRRVFNKGLNFRVTKHRDPDIIIKDIEYSLKQYMGHTLKRYMGTYP